MTVKTYRKDARGLARGLEPDLVFAVDLVRRPGSVLGARTRKRDAADRGVLRLRRVLAVGLERELFEPDVAAGRSASILEGTEEATCDDFVLGAADVLVVDDVIGGRAARAGDERDREGRGEKREG